MSSLVSCCKPSPGSARQGGQVQRDPPGGMYKGNLPTKLPILVTRFKTQVEEEPLPLAKNHMLAMLQFEKKERQLEEDIEQWECRISNMIDRLKMIKESVERAFTAQLVTQVKIEKINPSNKDELDHLLQLKCHQQHELMESIQQEDKYLHELHCAQQTLHEINVKTQSMAIEKLNRRIEEIYRKYEDRKDFLYRNRLRREVERNCILRKQKFRAVKNFVEKSLDQKLKQAEESSKSIRIVKKDAVRKVRYHFKLTSLRRRRVQEEAMLTHQGRQYKQKQSLLLLKEQIHLQRAELVEQNQLQAQQKQERERRKELHRQKLIAKGENPYVVDELIRVEEKIRAREQRAVDCQALAIEIIKREIVDRERAYKRAVANRRKWDKFWAAKAREKRKEHYNQFIKPYIADGKPSTRSDRWLQVAKDTYGYDPTRKEPAPCSGRSVNRNLEPLPTKSKHLKGQKSPRTLKANSPRKELQQEDTEPTHLKGKAPRGQGVNTSLNKSNLANIHPTGALQATDEESKEERQSDSETTNKTGSGSGWDYRCMPLGPSGDGEHLVKDNLKASTEQAAPSNAFSWSPQTILFQNYDVGKTYRLRVYVTNKTKQRLKYYYREICDSKESALQIPPNPPPSAIENGVRAQSPKVSSSAYDTDETQPVETPTSGRGKKMGKPQQKAAGRNSGRKQVFTAPMDDESLKAKLYSLSDSVKVNFTVPYPISPGLQHSFLITFQPKAHGDWAGKLKFTSELGNFEIPIQIQKRRFSPELDQTELSFFNTVVHTSVIRKVKLKNVGGLRGYLHRVSEPQPPRNFSEVDHDQHHLVFIKAPNVLNEESGDEGSTSQNTTGDTSQPTGKGSTNKRRKSKLIEDKKSLKSARKQKDQLPKYSSTREFQISKSDGNLFKGSSNPPSAQERKSELSNRLGAGIVRSILDDLLVQITDGIFVTYVEGNSRELEPGGELTLAVLFRPPFVSNFTSQVELVVGKNPDDELNTAKLTLDLTGSSVENPIYVQPLNGDFKICTVNQAYQLTVQVHTTWAKGAGKVRARVPLALRGYVDVFPQEPCTLFPSHPCQFAVHFTPKRLMLTSPGLFREFYDPETHIIDFPIYFHLKFPYKVPSPITATFMAIISDSLLQVEPKELDLGVCHTAETVRSVLNVHNPTSVMQKVGFVDIPEEIMVQPNYGFARILPGETIPFDVLMTADTKMPEGPFACQLRMESFGKDDYLVPVTGSVKRCSVRLTSYRILFPTTCCGSSTTTMIGIKPVIPPQKGMLSFPTYQVDLDPTIPIKISPQTGFLEPGKESKLFITFEPEAPEEEVRRTFLETAHIRYNELISGYQRELAAIQMHLENNWMLDEAAQSVSPSLPITFTSATGLSLPPQSRPLHVSVKNGGDHRKTSEGHIHTAEAETESKSSKPSTPTEEGSLRPPDTNATVKPPSRGSKAKTGRSAKGKKWKESLKPRKITEEHSRRKTAETGEQKSEHDTTNSHEDGQSQRQRLVKQLEERKKYVLSKISTPFEAPNTKTISTDSVEYHRAKRDYLKNLKPFSRVYQVPIFIHDAVSAETVILTVSCPTQRPDLILLNDSPTVDFGTVPLGQRAWREVHLFNVSLTSLTLRVTVFNPYGPFIQANALRSLAPEHVYTLKIRFEPTSLGRFEEHVTIYGGESGVKLVLMGTAKEVQVPTHIDGQLNDGGEIGGTAPVKTEPHHRQSKPKATMRKMNESKS